MIRPQGIFTKSVERGSSGLDSLAAPQDTTHSRFLVVLSLTVLVLLIHDLLVASRDSQLAEGAAIAIVILGLSWLIGWSGQISLGNSGFMAVGAYAASIWANITRPLRSSSPSFSPSSTGSLSGLIIAIPSTRLKGPISRHDAGLLGGHLANRPELHLGTGGENGQFLNELTTPKWFLHLFHGQMRH